MNPNEGPHRRGTRSNSCKEEIITSLLKTIDDVCNCISYQIESDTTLNYDDEKAFDSFEDDETDSVDESTDPGFDESAEGENMMIKANSSLELMKKVIDFYDARDSKGTKKSTHGSLLNIVLKLFLIGNILLVFVTILNNMVLLEKNYISSTILCTMCLKKLEKMFYRFMIEA